MGYNWEGMKRVSYEEAVKRFKDDFMVFLLYDDDTEGAAQSLEDMEDHCERGGEFGYEL